MAEDIKLLNSFPPSSHIIPPAFVNQQIYDIVKTWTDKQGVRVDMEVYKTGESKDGE